MSETIDLIDPETRAVIGTEVVRRTGVVSKAAFQRWASAVGDQNPLYFDPAYAREHGYDDVIMPPLFLQDISHPIVSLGELTADGMPTTGEVYSALRLPDCPRRMAAGTQTTFHAPLYDGDLVTSVTVVQSVEQKHGRTGEFVVATWVTTHSRADGTVVAEETRSLIARP